MYQADLYQKIYLFWVNGYLFDFFPTQLFLIRVYLTKLQANPSSMQVDGECHQKCNRNCNKKKSESLITCYINDYYSYSHR